MTGHYAHTIDAKGRLFIPAKLREELGSTFHVTVGPVSASIPTRAGPPLWTSSAA